jgi:hypothetical protein
MSHRASSHASSTSLQNRLRRFNSGRGLHFSPYSTESKVPPLRRETVRPVQRAPVDRPQVGDTGDTAAPANFMAAGDFFAKPQYV